MTKKSDQPVQAPLPGKASGENQVQVLLSERFSLVSQLTELNANHIKAETVRSGLEIEIASLEANLHAQETDSTIPSELDKLKEQYQQQADLQQNIDTERDDVSKKLDDIAAQLDGVY